MATAKAETKTTGIKEKLLNIQQELKAPKGQYNSFGKYKYRSCEDILEAVKPILAKYKTVLSISDEVLMVGERFYIKATATLSDAESDETISNTALAREEVEKKGQDASQITGTASSYARKYCLNGLFLIDDTKDADTDEYHKQTAKPEPLKEASEQECKDELNDLWERAGGKDGFEDWYKKNTEKGFSSAVYANMKATLMKKINEKETR